MGALDTAEIRRLVARYDGPRLVTDTIPALCDEVDRLRAEVDRLATAHTETRTAYEWAVTCEGLRVGGPFADRDDAEAFAELWNSAYPPADGYAEFVIVLQPNETRHIGRRP